MAQIHNHRIAAPAWQKVRFNVRWPLLNTFLFTEHTILLSSEVDDMPDNLVDR